MKPSFPGKYLPALNPKMGGKGGRWIFIILPLFYFFISMVYLNGVKQFYINNYDATYPYLLNGVNLASGNFRVGIVEHPGTPVEIFTGMVIFIKHFLTGNGILFQDVLLHPETYLFTCSMVLALLLSLATYFAGTYVFRHSGNVWLALLFQVAPLFYRDMVGITVSLSAESLITICGILFMPYLYVNTIGINQSSRVTTNKNATVFGLFTALLFTAKIYCAPIILLVFSLIKSRNQKITYLISFGIFTILSLFPLYNQLRNWAGWIKSMVFHSGAYGQGNSGILNASLYKSNIIELFMTHYIFTAMFIFVMAAFIVSFFGRGREKVSSSKFISPISGILISFILFVLIIAKQYKVIYPEPLTHQMVAITKFYYFIPLIICFPLIIAVCYKILLPSLSSTTIGRKILNFCNKQKCLYVAFGIFILYSGQKAYMACKAGREQNVALNETRQFLDGWKNTPLIIVSDGDKVCVEPALFLGISYSGRWDAPAYFDFMKKTYPDSYLYTTYNDELIHWNEKTDISSILTKNKQALVYSSGNDSIVDATILSWICGEKMQSGKGTYRKIYSSVNKYENIYLINTDTLR